MSILTGKDAPKDARYAVKCDCGCGTVRVFERGTSDEFLEGLKYDGWETTVTGGVVTHTCPECRKQKNEKENKA
jgi:hypothetical protein